jgi:hypothetical protein
MFIDSFICLPAAGINSGLGDFLQEMSFLDSDPVFVCVGAGYTMRGTHPIGGQVWKQGNREMSAVNHVSDGMDTGKESVILSAITEAVVWRHAMGQALDPNFKRPGQRVIIYPKSPTKFSECLQRGDHGSDLEGGHEIAYERIEAERSTFAHCPIFLPEDSPNIGNWPVLAENVSIWMEQAKQVAASGYKQVLEKVRMFVIRRVTRTTVTTGRNGKTRICTQQKCSVQTARK